MTPLRNRYVWLITSHLAVFGLAWSFARSGSAAVNPHPDDPVRTKSANRDTRSASSSDDARLLTDFMQATGDKKSPYQKLKEGLPAAVDPKAAFESAVDAYMALGNPGADQFAEMEVRAYHWLKQDPDQAIGYLMAETHRFEILALLRLHVIPDVISEHGLLKSLGWLKKNQIAMECVPAAAVKEIKAGGGLSLFLQLEEIMSPDGQAKGAGGSSYAWRDYYKSVGKAIAFEERGRFLDCVNQQVDPGRQRDLLLGFAEGSQPAMTWLMDLIRQEQLDPALAARLRGGLGNEVLNKPEMEIDARVEARRATKGNENKDRQSIINEIVGGDVKRLLLIGRDWRYEFRTGVSSLDEVLTAVREGLPQVPSEGENALLVSLYQQLAEENPGKALPLLDSLPEEKRREVLFSNTWVAFGGNNPDIFMRFLNGLPEPATEKEKAERIKGWDWKARPNLARYGDDYVDWVVQLPPGLDRDRAMNSLVWATREQNPAKARELEARLYPKKP